MKLTNHLFLSSALLSISFATQCCDAFAPQQLSISVRQATLNDMDQINAISEKQYHHDFKPMWEKFYVPLFQLKEDINERVEKMIKANENNNRAAIESQNNQGESRLLVAETSMPHQSPRIAGFLRFERKSQRALYVNFILVDENFRNHGVAKKLTQHATRTWPEVEEAQFRAMITNQEINDLYLRLGAQQTGKICIYPDGNTSTDSDAPQTHYNYSYLIKGNK